METLCLAECLVLAYVSYMNKNDRFILDADDLVKDLSLGKDEAETIIDKLVRDNYLLLAIRREACGSLPAEGQRLYWTGKGYPRIPWIDILKRIDYDTCLNKHMLYQDCSLEEKVQFLTDMLWRRDYLDTSDIEELYEMDDRYHKVQHKSV